MKAVSDTDALRSGVRKAVAEATATDIHTHLFPPSHGNLLLWGIDELLTYHYLVAEFFDVAPRDLSPEKFWQMPKAAQADLVWEHLFLRRSPLSESACGLVTTLNALGLDVAGRRLADIRNWFSGQKLQGHVARVFELAGIDCAVMTNDPFRPEEAAQWAAGPEPGELMKPVLRVDPVIVNWPLAARSMSQAGYKTEAVPDEAGCSNARRFLLDWGRKLRAVYMAASLPPEFRYPARDVMARAVKNVVLPVARELNVPLALMIGVRRSVNPSLREGGDAVGVADVTAVQNLCSENPDVKFLVTMLSRVNQHELCVCARKFSNLHVFGCWWFCNTAGIIDEITRMRLELLGTAFTVNHSDARVLEQVIYKWSRTRSVLADALADKYADLLASGWLATQDEINRDVRRLLGGAFEEFLAR